MESFESKMASYLVDNEGKKIVLTGTLEELVRMVKAIHRARYPNGDRQKLDEEIDASLTDEMRHMVAYSRGEITGEELQDRCIDLPQLTFGLLHRIKFAIDHTASRPSIKATYFANDLPNEDHFDRIKANFKKAIG